MRGCFYGEAEIVNFTFWGWIVLCLFLLVFALQPLIALSFKDIDIVTAVLAAVAGIFLGIGLIKRQHAF